MNNIKASFIRNLPTIFLRALIILLGIGVLVFMLWEPHLEGRNINSTLFQIYFNDPFLIYAYIGSIPFFVALYQAFKLLGYIGHARIFSLESVRALRTIRHCAIAIITFAIPPLAYLLIARPGYDIAGGVAIGLFIIFVSTIVASVSAILERLLKSIVDIKSINRN